MGKVKTFFHNLPIRTSFMLYMLVFLLIAALLSSIAVNAVDLTKSNALREYVRDGGTLVSGDGITVTFQYIESQLPDRLRRTVNFCDFLSWFSLPAIFLLCIFTAAVLFYRNKLKAPIAVLDRASRDIAGNDLSSPIRYDSRDEMGRLCQSFEKMRSSLEQNNRAMWRDMEERKRLNAAFAHDLRTPLTVLRGYADFLKNYLPEDRLPREKVLATVSTMALHIARLEGYVETMVSLQKLEAIEPSPEELGFRTLSSQLRDTAEALRGGRDLTFLASADRDTVRVDPAFLSRVLENLLSNAVRHAKSHIAVTLSYAEDVLRLTVEDDGDGFTDEALQRAADPFYRGEADGDSADHKGDHFGLGLNISRVLCEKHGGSLQLSNRDSGGAGVEASFKAI